MATRTISKGEATQLPGAVQPQTDSAMQGHPYTFPNKPKKLPKAWAPGKGNSKSLEPKRRDSLGTKEGSPRDEPPPLTAEEQAELANSPQPGAPTFGPPASMTHAISGLSSAGASANSQPGLPRVPLQTPDQQPTAGTQSVQTTIVVQQPGTTQLLLQTGQQFFADLQPGQGVLLQQPLQQQPPVATQHQQGGNPAQTAGQTPVAAKSPGGCCCLL